MHVRTSHPGGRWLRVSVVCGATPLVVGTGIFLAWFITRWTWLAAAGLITIYAGLVLFTVGTVCLGVYVVRSLRSASGRSRDVALRAVGAATILLANFPAAAGIFWAALLIETQYRVAVTNNSPAAVDSFRVTGGGVDIDFGTIEPHATVTRRFHIQHDGQLVFRMVHMGRPTRGCIDGYVTNNLGGDARVTIGPAGQVEVREH